MQYRKVIVLMTYMVLSHQTEKLYLCSLQTQTLLILDNGEQIAEARGAHAELAHSKPAFANESAR